MNKQVLGELQGLKARCGSLRAMAEYMGLAPTYAAVLSDMMNGKEHRISRKRRNEVLHCLNHWPEGAERLEQVPTSKLADLIRWRQDI